MIICYKSPRKLVVSKIVELVNIKNGEGSKILPFYLNVNELV